MRSPWPGRHYAAVTGTGSAERMNIRYPRSASRIAGTAAGLSLLALAACAHSAATSAASAASPAASGPAATGQSPAKPVDGCALVTAAELSQAAGVRYTAISNSGTGTICNVTGASETDSFYYHVDREDGTLTTWNNEVGTIKEDDGSVTGVAGIGDRAAQGAVKEFAAETGGYIVVVVNADVNNPPTSSSFTRTKLIEKLLVSKL